MTIRDIAIAFGYEVDKSSEKKVESSVNNLKSFATKALGAISVGVSLVKLNGLLEEFGAINVKINAATKSLGEQKDIQNKIMTAANNCRGTYDNMATAVTTLLSTDKKIFDTVEKTAQFAELTSKAFKAVGKNDTEIASLQSTIANVFKSGKASATDFQKVVDAAPNSVNYLSKALGVSEDKVKALGKAGSITGQQIYDAFVSNADDINSAYGNLDMTITDALKHIRNRWGLWVTQMDKTIGITNNISKFMVRGFNSIMSVLNKVTTFMERLAKKVGGADNLFKLLVTTAGAIFVALNAQKIMSFLQTVGKLLGGINLKVFAIIAIIVALFLIVDDFVNFMKGNDSMLGVFFEKIGIDAEAVRDKIKNVWNAIKDFLTGVWEGIKGAAEITWDAIKDFFARHGDRIWENFRRYWNIVKDFLTGIWTFISQVAGAIFGDTEKSIDGSQEGVKDGIVSTWQQILDIIVPILDALFEVWDTCFNAIATVVETIFGIIKAFWDRWGNDIIRYFKKLWDGFKLIIDGILKVIKGISDFVSGVFTGDWQKAWDGIKEIFGGIWEVCKGVVQNFVAFITTIFKIAWDIIKDIWNGVVSFFQGIWDGIVSVFSSVGEWFAGVFQSAWDGIVEIWSSVVDWFSGVWDGIVSVFSVVAEWFSSIFTEAWNGIQNAFSTVGSFFQGIWDTIKNMFVNIGVTIGEGISGAFKSVVNAVIGFASRTINGFIGTINGAIGTINKIPGVSIPTISSVSLPQLAEGGYVGANSPRTVIIGDNPTEGEIVSPEGKLFAIMVDALNTFVAKNRPTQAASTLTNVSNSKSVAMNVNIQNSFSGGTLEAQKKGAETMRKSATDATAIFARGLAYAR